MGIGPELPPHLAQQLGRSTERSPEPVATEPKLAGPQLPASAATIGPSIPSTLQAGPSAPASTATVADDDSDDDFGPALPPDLAQARQAGPSRPLGPSLPRSTYSPPPRAGPTMPTKRETPLSAAYSDDSDNDFGPMPLPAGVQAGQHDVNEGARLFKEREEREKEKERREREDKGKLKREEWMLVPPKEMDLMSTMDPTKLKSRSFASSTKTAEKEQNSSGVNLWTETPQERKQRLADEVMGRKRKAADGGEDETDEQRRKRERDQRLREEVEKHNRTSRNASLLDQHTSSGASKKLKPGEKEVPGIWDRDRDMSVGGRLMDDKKRSDIVRNAKDLGGRFGGGGYL